MNVGIVCYPSVGGSGIVATELAKALARRGHAVHVISTEMPFRLGDYQEGLSFHQVVAPTYPLFREPQYLLSLANKIVQVARDARLDIVHAHYAVPHATAAFLARRMLEAGFARDRAPGVVTTLHGTDITLVGNEPSYSDIVAFSIDQSDAVTAVSESLRAATVRELGVRREILVIPNFLDCGSYRRVPAAPLRRHFAGDDPSVRVVVHVSNFRPVKQPRSVVEVFARVVERVPARLLLVGDGPDLALALRTARDAGVASLVHALGAQENIVPLLSISDVFVLPSRQESFGLAALEAMACGVPVIASLVGGIPEVVEDGVSGCLHEPDDLDGMARSAVELLLDADRHARFAAAARATVEQRFCAERVVPLYERCYERVRS